MATNTLDKQADLAARAAAWQHSRDPTAMLLSAGQALAEGRISVLDPRRLRLLAVWSAVFVNTHSWPAIEGAKAFLRFETQPGAMARARDAAGGDAADARSMGLPQCIPEAAAQLAAYATTCSDPLQAAMEAVSYAVKATAWRDVERIMKTDARKADSPRIREYLLAHPQLESQCDAAARPRFADACRLFVGNPFEGRPGTITFAEINRLLEPLPEQSSALRIPPKPAPIPSTRAREALGMGQQDPAKLTAQCPGGPPARLAGGPHHQNKRLRCAAAA